jgi:hypothetical protein
LGATEVIPVLKHLRLGVTQHTNQPGSFVSSQAMHPSFENVTAGNTDIEMLRLRITTAGTVNLLEVEEFVFNDKGTDFITAAKL